MAIHIHLPARKVVKARDSRLDNLKRELAAAKSGLSRVSGHVAKGNALTEIRNLKRKIQEEEKKTGDAAAPAKLKAHPQFTQADYDYFKAKGWSDSEILKRWDEEKRQGVSPQRVNKLAKPGQPGFPYAKGTEDKSFIDILNDPEGRDLVDAIEDTIASLKGKKGDKILEGVLARQKAELKRKFGFTWQNGVRDASPAIGDEVKIHIKGQSLRGTVKAVRGNLVSVAYIVTSGGNKFNRLDDFHVSKVFSASGKAFSSNDSKDSRDYLSEAKAATVEANNKTKEATKYGSPHNHTQASISHYAAGMSWTNVANVAADPNEKAEAKKKSEEHRRQSDFHYKNSIA